MHTAKDMHTHQSMVNLTQVTRSMCLHACFNILDEESFYAHYFRVNIMIAFAFLNIQRARGEGFVAMWRCEKIFVHFIFITSIMRLIIRCLQYITKDLNKRNITLPTLVISTVCTWMVLELKRAATDLDEGHLELITEERQPSTLLH